MATPIDDKFKKNAEDMAKFGFGTMRIFAMEHRLSREHLVFALASLCIEVREGYPDGAEEFDRIAAEAQKHYEASKK